QLSGTCLLALNNRRSSPSEKSLFSSIFIFSSHPPHIFAARFRMHLDPSIFHSRLFREPHHVSLSAGTITRIEEFAVLALKLAQTFGILVACSLFAPDG